MWSRWVDRHECILRFNDLWVVTANAVQYLESSNYLKTSQFIFQLSKTHHSSKLIIAIYFIEKLIS